MYLSLSKVMTEKKTFGANTFAAEFVTIPNNHFRIQ